MTLKELFDEATPRPWRKSFLTLRSGNVVLADFIPLLNKGEDEANARLAAHAINVLPELLEASKKLMVGCESYLAANGHTLRISGMLAVQKAIANAEEVK